MKLSEGVALVGTTLVRPVTRSVFKVISWVFQLFFTAHLASVVSRKYHLTIKYKLISAIFEDRRGWRTETPLALDFLFIQSYTVKPLLIIKPEFSESRKICSQTRPGCCPKDCKITYGAPVQFMFAAEGLADTPLYMASDAINTAGGANYKSGRRRVFLNSEKFSYNTQWKFEHMDPQNRLEMEGQPVPVKRCLADSFTNKHRNFIHPSTNIAQKIHVFWTELFSRPLMVRAIRP